MSIVRMFSVPEDCGRLEVVLDRSWEVQPVTWAALTWWDPLPCGPQLLAQLHNPDPLPFPSPALSVVGHPPPPRRKLPPTHLHFRSTSVSPSPIPARARSYSFRDRSGSSSASPLACPLPPSPDSGAYNSVFLHSDSASPAVSPRSGAGLYCSSPVFSRGMFPTPPDSVYHHRHTRGGGGGRPRSGNKFSFSKVGVAPPAPLPGHSYSQSALAMVTPPSFSDAGLRSSSLCLPVPEVGYNTSYY